MKKNLFLLPLVAIALAGCGETACEHVDANKDHKCDKCSQVVSQHADGNKDHLCDTCSAKISEHAWAFSADAKHKCSVCGAEEACADANSDNKCDVCGHEMATQPVALNLTLEFDNMYEAAGSTGTGYDKIAAITSIGGYSVSFTNVCLNLLNSTSTPAWTTPNDEQLEVVQFKNAKTAAGVITFPKVTCNKVSIYLLTSYDVDNDFSVTFGTSVITLESDEGEDTEYKSGTGSKTYDIKRYVLTFNVNGTTASDLKINNNGQGARYLEKIVIE